MNQVVLNTYFPFLSVSLTRAKTDFGNSVLKTWIRRQNLKTHTAAGRKRENMHPKFVKGGGPYVCKMKTTILNLQYQENRISNHIIFNRTKRAFFILKFYCKQDPIIQISSQSSVKK